MLTLKWATLNANCQKFNSIHKRALSSGKSGENEMDAMRQGKKMFKDKHRGRSFAQESSWEILRVYPKWDAPDSVLSSTVNVKGTSGGNAEGTVELFGEDKRPRPPGARASKKTKSESSSRTAKNQTSVFTNSMSIEFRLKRESAQEKDRTVIKFEELRFLTTKTDGLSEEDANSSRCKKNLFGQNIEL
ncbi:hypothetical protein Tco_0571254, partial [Tanacetum coccineum]